MIYRELNDKEMCKYFGHLEDHEYKHYSQAFGCYVHGKNHLKYLMRKYQTIPYEMALGLVKENTRKDYKLSKEADKFMRSLKLMADSKGNLTLGSVAISKMKELGVSFDSAERELSIDKGGFS